MQIDKLVELQKQGGVELQKLGDTGMWYQENFQMSAATAQVAERDWCGNNLKTVWYNCKNYRANLFLVDGRLLLRDLTKFDDRYQERYLEVPCENWLAIYDNLPVVDSRIWSRENAPCELSLQKEVVDIHSAEQTETTLCVSVIFADGTDGAILFYEEGISFEGCGDIMYRMGTPDVETTQTVADGKLCGMHNGFEYQVGIAAEIVPQTDGILLRSENEKVYLQMNLRIEQKNG